MDNTSIKQSILDQIIAHDRIIISRHRLPDGDCTGATKGLQRILQLTFPHKQVLLINSDYSQYLSFLGGEDAPIADEDYHGALVIVLDTGNVGRISNPKYDKGEMLIKIDHHIDATPYGDISWVEDWRSSVCEMIVDFYTTFSDTLRIDNLAATYLYTGMVTDTGRFKYGISAQTLRNAAVLLQQGVEVDRLYAQLGLDDFDYLLFKAYIYRHLKRTPSGVVYIHVTQAMRAKFNLSYEQACNVVGLMDGIRDSLIWLAFIDDDNGAIRVRLRSRFVEVEPLARQFGGGGHACAAGATVHNRTQMRNLIDLADQQLAQYKQTHTDWL